MGLRIGDLTLLDDLPTHFVRSGGAVETADGPGLDVRRPVAPSEEFHLPRFLLWTLGCMHLRP